MFPLLHTPDEGPFTCVTSCYRFHLVGTLRTSFYLLPHLHITSCQPYIRLARFDKVRDATPPRKAATLSL